LSRRMLVAGGTLLRDAAAAEAMIPRNKEGIERRGVLSRAMYLVYAPEEETQVSFTYKVSWNRIKAPHGHLVEFGYWQTHKVYKASNGEWYTLKDQPLASPKWIPGSSFLGSTFDSYGK